MAVGRPFDPEKAEPGQLLTGIDPLSLKAGRANVVRWRLRRQRNFILRGIRRWTPIEVTISGVIYSGNHAVRVAAEMGLLVDVVVIEDKHESHGSIMDLPVTER